MKLFKKAVATVLAAVLALSMLTACGGSGADASNMTMKTLGKGYTMTVTNIGATRPIPILIVTDGERTYVQMHTSAELQLKDTVYAVNPTTTPKRAFNTQSTEAEMDLSSMLPMSDEMKSGQREYMGKTYQTESIAMAVEGFSISYCFDNGKLAYIIQDYTEDGQTTSAVLRVDEFSTTVDTSVFNISNYQVVATEDELYA